MGFKRKLQFLTVILFGFLMLSLMGPKAAMADMPALCFDSGCTYGIQIPGADDWRQTNAYNFQRGDLFSGLEGAFSHQWYFESFIGGVVDPSNTSASTLNGYATEDFDAVGFLHSLNTPNTTVISDNIAAAVEFDIYGGYQFVHAAPIYGFKFNFKL